LKGLSSLFPGWDGGLKFKTSFIKNAVVI
jgi:hypothetical protein